MPFMACWKLEGSVGMLAGTWTEQTQFLRAILKNFQQNLRSLFFICKNYTDSDYRKNLTPTAIRHVLPINGNVKQLAEKTNWQYHPLTARRHKFQDNDKSEDTSYQRNFDGIPLSVPLCTL